MAHTSLPIFLALAIFQIWRCDALGIKVKSQGQAQQAIVNQNTGGEQHLVIDGNLDVEVDTPGSSSGTGTGVGVIPQFPPSGTSNIVRGLECGSTVQMYPGNSAQVFSTNFGIAHYYNYEACTWKFQANQCTLSAYCPCADIPKSWECLGDYLKISTDFTLHNQRFCGGNRPGQPIYSDTDYLSIRFRSDGKTTAAGFTCFVRCEAPGMQLAIISNVTCPTSASLRLQLRYNK